MNRDRKALGEAGLHVIRTAAEGCKEIDRQKLRARIDEMKRPSPGTSELLSRPMVEEVTIFNGKDVTMFDFIGGGSGEARIGGLAPVHLLGGVVDREIRVRNKKRGA